MGIDSFDKANASLDFSRDEVSNVAGLVKDKEVLFDVFSILATLGIILWITILMMSLFTSKLGFSYSFAPIVGYVTVILIIIYTSRKVYLDIESDINKKCGQEGGGYSLVNDNYLIESTNRFYSILSFVYFYVKTYVMTLINISLFSLGLFIFHHALFVNIEMERDDSWAILVKRKLTNESQSIILKVFGYIYYIFGFFVYVYIHLVIFLYLSSNLLFDYPIFKRISWIANINLVAGVLVLLFIPVILYFNDRLTDAWRNLIIRDRKENGKDLIYPVLEIFRQGHIFEYMNLTDKESAQRHIRIFLFGLVISAIFAFVILPSFDVERLCVLKAVELQNEISDTQEEELNNLTIRSKEFHSRFKFGYFVMIIVTVFFHLCDLSMKSFFVSIDSRDFVRDEKELKERDEVREYIIEANEIKSKFKRHDIYLIRAFNDIVDGTKELSNKPSPKKEESRIIQNRIEAAQEYIVMEVRSEINKSAKMEAQMNEKLGFELLGSGMSHIWKDAKEKILKMGKKDEKLKEDETIESLYIWKEAVLESIEEKISVRYEEEIQDLKSADVAWYEKNSKNVDDALSIAKDLHDIDKYNLKDNIKEKDKNVLIAEFITSVIDDKFMTNFDSALSKYKSDLKKDNSDAERDNTKIRAKANEMIQFLYSMINEENRKFLDLPTMVSK